MTSLPLHPAIVHLPLGLAFVVPFLATWLTWSLWRGRLPRRSWLMLVALQALLVVAGIAALRSGEREQDRVERVVAEALIGRHEAMAEAFVWGAGIALALALAALLLREGAGARLLRASTTVASIVTLALAIRVGHAGGELVYRHGAASAYSQASAPGQPAGAIPAEEED